MAFKIQKKRQLKGKIPNKINVPFSSAVSNDYLPEICQKQGKDVELWTICKLLCDHYSWWVLPFFCSLDSLIWSWISFLLVLSFAPLPLCCRFLLANRYTCPMFVIHYFSNYSAFHLWHARSSSFHCLSWPPVSPLRARSCSVSVSLILLWPRLHLFFYSSLAGYILDRLSDNQKENPYLKWH